MIPQKMRTFISNVYGHTADDKLRWFEADNLAYFCDHKNTTLHISNHFDTDRDESYFRFTLSTDGKATPFTVYDDERDYKQMRQLWEAIIINANNIDIDLDDFFR